MTNEEFSALVRDMRTAQNDYFKTRSKDALNKSKRLEKQVDEALHKHYNPDTQQALFEAENQDGNWKRTSKELPHPGEFVNCIYRHGFGYQVAIMQVEEVNLQDGLLLYGCAECIMWQSITIPNIQKEDEQ